jgi:hypothetical protein
MADYLRFYAKGNGAMEEYIAPGREIQLEEVRLHLSAAGGASENFDTIIDSAEGSEYDIVLNAQDMNSATDEHYQPTRPVPIRADDTLKFTYDNTNSQTWGLEVVYRPI